MHPIIQLEAITKDFGAFRALDNVTLGIEPGITGLLGPNGAGKSTLIKILLGLLRPTSGTGQLLGLKLGSQTKEIRASVGYMPEDDCFLYALNGLQSVHLSAQLSGFPKMESLRRAHEILDFCGLAQERYRAVETYSTGMRQKLRFAQAIVHDPPILILDEPTSGLDPEERDIMLRRIRRLADDHEKTILLCTHILPDVQTVSDAVVILAQGQVRVADQLQNLSRPTQPSMQVRVIGSADDLIAGLGRAGFSSEQTQWGGLTVRGDHGDLAKRIWQTAHQTGTTISGLAPSMNSLEEIFLAAVKGESNGSS